MAKGKKKPEGEQPKEILHFSLEGLLEEDQVIFWNPNRRTMGLLGIKDGMPTVLAEVQFSEKEHPLLLPFLSSDSHIVEYSILLNVFEGDISVQQTQERIEKASKAGEYDGVIRPLRNILARIRPKIQKLGLTIVALPQASCYMLTRYSEVASE